MKITQRTYISRAIIYVTVFFASTFLYQLDLSSQTKIFVDAEPVQVYSSKIPKKIVQTGAGYQQSWENIDEAIIPNGVSSSLNYESVKFSKRLKFSNFNFNVPVGAKIDGVELVLYTDVEGLGYIFDDGIYLQDKNGVDASVNKASKYYPSKALDTDTSKTIKPMIYGFNNDTWGKNWTPEDINSSKFGASIEFRSLTADQVELLLDHVVLNVYYTPLAKVCDGGCAIFSVDDKDNETYEWIIPQGFELISSTVFDDAINLHPSYATYGIYEICVKTYNSQGVSTTCRDFTFKNCVPQARIGGIVFEDQNFNGSFDSNESTYEGLGVYLYDSNNNLADITVSDYGGYYQFDDIMDGKYYVNFDFPIDRYPTKLNNNLNDLSNYINSNGNTGEFILAAGDELLYTNAGFVGLGSIGDFVWFDDNRDGLQDSTENGIADLKVLLYDAAGNIKDSTVTTLAGNNPNYLFSDIYPGDYFVKFPEIDSFKFTTYLQNNLTINSDVTGANGIGTSSTFSLLPLANITDIDAGYVIAGGTIKGNVVYDTNTNDMLDTTDQILSDYTIQLFNSNGVLVNSAVTDDNGYYQFYPVDLGDFYLKYDTIPGFTPSEAYVGGDFLKDFDITGANGAYTSDLINVIPGVTYRGINAGLIDGRGSIAGLVWLDKNGNGIQDPDEELLDEVTVDLYNSIGLLNSTITDEFGVYTFENLVPDAYYIKFNSPVPNYFATSPQVGSNVQIDSDITGQNGDFTTNLYTLNLFDNLEYINAGLTGNGSLITTVFFDVNENGLSENGENGVEGISVSLIDNSGTIVQSDITDANGEVNFEAIAAGIYQLEYTKDFTYLYTTANVGTDENLDSDVIDINGEMGTTASFVIFVNEERTDVDAGLILAGGTVKGQVVNDENLDNVIDAADSPREGTLVSIYNSNNELVTTTTTDSEGNYTFYPILEGDYYLTFESEAGFVYSEANFSGTVNQDFVTDATGKSDTFSVFNQMTVDNQNAGYQDARGSIAGIVWLDKDGSGVLDNSEQGIGGEQVELYGAGNTLIASTTTAADGSYTFNQIIPSTYYLSFSNSSADLYFTAANVGADDNLDSEVTGLFGDGSTDLFTIANFANISNYNAGLTGNGSLITTVFFDANENGLSENGENGVEGISVSLIDNSGVVVQSDITDANGEVNFEAIAAGIYQLEYTKDFTYLYTSANVGADENLDSDVVDINGEMGTTASFVIFVNEERTDVDAGLILAGGRVMGSVVLDENLNNIIDDLDSALAGIKVELYNTDNDLINTTTTDDTGKYQFYPILEGDYYIVFESQEGFLFSEAFNSGVENQDFDVTSSISQGSTDAFTVVNMSAMENVNAGYQDARASLSGLVWFDENGSALYDDFEDGIEGVVVKLVSSSNNMVIIQDTTDINGLYQFHNIVAANYYLRFESIGTDVFFTLANIGNDEAIDSEVTGTFGYGSTAIIEVKPFDNITNVFAGVTGNGSIESMVFFDENNNGIKDITEGGLANVLVNLYRDGSVVSSLLTDQDGNFSFMDVLVGPYHLEFIGNTLYTFTSPNVGTDENIDSDVDDFINNFGKTSTFNVVFNETNTENTAGFILATGSINGYVVIDTDENNILDLATDQAIGNSPVMVFKSNGDLATTVFTNGNGFYNVSLLPVGDYFLVFDTIAGYGYSNPYVSTNEDLDFDIDFSNGDRSTRIISISNGESESGVNAGYIDKRATLSGIAFLDLENDGVFDNLDQAIANVKVELILAADGSVIFEALTDIDGTYTFEDIIPNDYYIKYSDYSSDFVFVLPYQGVDELIDSDVTEAFAIGSTDLININLDEIIEGVNAGFTSFGFVGSTVFVDANENGVFENGETGLEGVEVFLYDENNMLVLQTMTDNNGDFLFSNVLAGQYYMEFSIPQSFKFTAANVGVDENIDSDAVEINASLGQTNTFNVIVGNTTQDITAGVISSKGGISGVVVEDLNRNHLLDNFDDKLAGIAVVLFDENDNFIKTTSTNSEGFYQFLDVVIGNYYIVFPSIEGFIFSNPNVGANDNIDFEVTSSITEGSTNLFTVLDNQNVANLNAGFIDARGTIQGMVWVDRNANGLKEGNETFVSDKEVMLYNDLGVLIDTKTTDLNGNYQFNNLLFGDYYVLFDVLEQDEFFATADVGTDETIDSDVTMANGANTTDLFSIVEFTQLAGVNAGVTGYGTVASMVFLDANENGIFDTDELGLAIESVDLFNNIGDLIATVNTNMAGEFIFENILPGSYFMQFHKTSDYEFTLANQGNDEALDSDVIGSNGNYGISEEFEVFYNEITSDYTAGLILSVGSIEGNVVIDMNNNNEFDTEDGPIENHEVSLINIASMDVVQTTTDAEGYYIFNGILPGSYYVVFDSIENLDFSLPNIPTDELIDFDVENTFEYGSSHQIDISAGAAIKGVNAGYVMKLNSIMGTVWTDCNGDGIFNNEMGIDSFEVKLLDTLGVVIDSVFTDTLGQYTFQNIAAGAYQVYFNLTDTMSIFSPAYVGMDNLIDSDIIDSLGMGLTDTLFLFVDNNLKGINAGIPGIGSINSIVFNDLNENGIFDDNEEGLAGVEVMLTNDNNEVVSSMVTDDTGLYQFEAVYAGNYTMQFKKPLFYIFTEANVGGNDTLDSDVISIEGLFGSTAAFTVSCDSAITTISAGLFFMTPMESKIEGLVWDDSNPDGIKVAGEPLMPNIEVKLFNDTGAELATTMTDALGYYEFNDLMEGFYYLRVKLANGRTITKFISSNPTDTTSVFNGDNGKGTTSDFYVGIQDTLKNYNAGIANELMLIGLVWDDLNADGIRDDGEPFLPNVLVTVKNGNGVVVDAKMTGATGNYLFNELTAGEYEISIQLPDGYLATRYKVGQPNLDNDFLKNGSTGVINYPASVVTGIDAGIAKTGSIGDFVWADFNGNGAQQGNEPGVDNVTIMLYDANDMLVATTKTITDTNGNKGFYIFDNVQPNDYYIKVTPPENYIFTTPGVFAPLFDSNITEANGEGTSDLFTLGYEEARTDIDAGIFIPGSIGDRVWLDQNANGLQDSGEPGIEGIIIELFRSNGTSLGMDTTDVNGDYMFMELSQGLYFISVVNSAGNTFTQMDVGNDDTIDSDVNPSGDSPLINLGFSVMFMNLDVGILPPGFDNEDDTEEGIVQEPTDQELQAIKDAIMVYPNPAVDYVKIENLKDEAYIYYIHDERGNTIFRGELLPEDTQTFSLDRFGTGMYYVKINYKGKEIAKPIIIIK